MALTGSRIGSLRGRPRRAHPASARRAATPGRADPRRRSRPLAARADICRVHDSIIRRDGTILMDQNHAGPSTPPARPRDRS